MAANTEARKGLVNPRLITGGSPHIETRPVVATYTTIFYPGQLVAVVADGTVIQKIVDANNTYLGVCMSFLPAASTGAVAQVDEVQIVTDMHNTIWELQVSTSLTGTTLRGMNVSLADLSGVSAAVRQSRMHGGTPITGLSPWKIVGFPEDDANHVGAANCRVLVKMNLGSTARSHYTTDTGI